MFDGKARRCGRIRTRYGIFSLSLDSLRLRGREGSTRGFLRRESCSQGTPRGFTASANPARQYAATFRLGFQDNPARPCACIGNCAYFAPLSSASPIFDNGEPVGRERIERYDDSTRLRATVIPSRGDRELYLRIRPEPYLLLPFRIAASVFASAPCPCFNRFERCRTRRKITERRMIDQHSLPLKMREHFSGIEGRVACGQRIMIG